MRSTTTGERVRSADPITFEEVRTVFWKGARPVEALADVSFLVQPAEFVAVIGPSGCGKSTLLNIAAGLLRPTSGRVLRHGAPLSGVQTSVGYVTQKDNLLPWRTAKANAAIALELHGVSRAQRERRVGEWLERLGLKGFEEHYPNELSGGMRKRVSLARTLIADPDVLLMDEPFGALDAQLRLILQQQLLGIWESSERSVLFVTHDLQEAITLADRVVVISARPGRVRAVVDIGLPRPRDVLRIRFTPRFGELYEELWAHLDDDVRRGEENA